MFVSYYFRKFLKLFVSQTRKLSRFLLLTVNISPQGLVFTLNSIVSLQDPPQCLRSLFSVHSGRVLSHQRKRKISQNDHSLSLVVIRCHSLSLVVPLDVTRCTTRCHPLSFVVICCHSLYHLLSLDVSLFCLFINDPSRVCYENMQQIYRRTTVRKYNFKNVAKQFYGNQSSAGVFSCELTAYFQNTFSLEHLQRTASVSSIFLKQH